MLSACETVLRIAIEPGDSGFLGPSPGLEWPSTDLLSRVPAVQGRPDGIDGRIELTATRVFCKHSDEYKSPSETRRFLNGP